MADILITIAAVEWIALGLLVLWRIRVWDKRFQKLHDNLKKDMERWNDSDVN